MSTLVRPDSPTMALGRNRRSVARCSDFDLCRMPVTRIKKRTPNPSSVHHSLATGSWIATISRPESIVATVDAAPKLRYIQFPFPTEREARKFCVSYAPPKFAAGGLCSICDSTSQRHCRNCGASVCDRCSLRWGSRMVPKTYMSSPSTTVRVCRSCDWLSNAFCLSLLQGRYQDALTIHSTGNVNLRTSFADIHREAMFPIHCAVMGGNMNLVQWLVDTQLCPLSVKCDAKTRKVLSLQTSAGRTLMDLAMTGRPKLDILMYLVRKGLSIDDVKDTSLVSKTLEVVMRSGAVFPDADKIPSSGSIGIHEIDVVAHYDESVTTDEDACKLCYERSMDCVLQPCGHQLCCNDCGAQLTSCPICKAACTVLRIYRP